MSKTIHTCVSIPEELLEKEKSYDLNVSKCCSQGLKAAVEREEKIKELGL